MLMQKLLEIYSYGNHQQQLKDTIECLKNNGVIAIPTDSGYALICKMGNKKAIDKLKNIRNLNDNHNLTILCRDLSEISNYAKIDNNAYRVLKRNTPAMFTFVLLATKQVSSLLVAKNKKTIGIRVSEHFLPTLIANEFNEVLVTTSFILPNDENVITDIADVSAEVLNQIDIIIESDYCGFLPTTVVDLTELPYKILRQGEADASNFIDN